jgi:hypothetical protein
MLDLTMRHENLRKIILMKRYWANPRLTTHHIAIATVNRIDVLESWNFKHIVNLDKIRLFNYINIKLGYPTIDIRSPKRTHKI